MQNVSSPLCCVFKPKDELKQTDQIYKQKIWYQIKTTV